MSKRMILPGTAYLRHVSKRTVPHCHKYGGILLGMPPYLPFLGPKGSKPDALRQKNFMEKG